MVAAGSAAARSASLASTAAARAAVHVAPRHTVASAAALASNAAVAQTRATEPAVRADVDARVALLRSCAPAVDPTTLLAVIAVESGGDPLAVNINRGARVHPRTVEDAVATAEAAIEAGYSVDLGLMQVNSRNLDALGATVAAMFDPCANVHAGAVVLTDAYAAAVRAYGEGQPALRAALSAYNTGDFARGFSNGYVARYYRGTAAPAWEVAPPASVEDAERALAGAVNPYTASPTVFTRTPWTPMPTSVVPASDRTAALP